MLSSLQTPQKSPKTPVKVAEFVAFDKKKVARRMICLCYNQCLKWGEKCTSVFILIFINPQYTVLHILSHCTSYSLFYFIICSYFHSHLYLYIYIYFFFSCVMFHCFIAFFCILFIYFFALCIERTCPDLHFTTDYTLYDCVCDK